MILNISSVSGSRPNPRGVAYGAAKAGLENMGRTLAHEWGPEVRVVTVTVGLILTEESERFYGDATGRAAVAGNLAMKTPRGPGRGGRHVLGAGITAGTLGDRHERRGPRRRGGARPIWA